MTKQQAQFCLFNLTGLFGIYLLYHEGWLNIYNQDTTYISFGIMVLFAYTLFASILGKVAFVTESARWMQFIGLIGTVVGFIVALSGVTQGAIDSAETVKTMVGTLLSGMQIALLTTLTGSVCSLWTQINRWIIE